MGRMFLGALVMFAGGAIWRSGFNSGFSAVIHPPLFFAGLGVFAVGALLSGFGARSLRENR